MLVADLKRAIREIKDFPKEGINFYDLSTLFGNAEAFRSAMDRLIEKYKGEKLDAVAAIEARGFIPASIMSRELGVGLVMLRKPGKLPADTVGEQYDLEYGSAGLEVHKDALKKEQRVVIVDDLLATGGTAAAAGRLLQRLGARVEGYAFLVELKSLGGRKPLSPPNVFSLIQYD